MINCPFCGEVFDEDDLVYEFRWGDIAGFYYRDKKLRAEPPSEFINRPVYIKMSYVKSGLIFTKQGPEPVMIDTVINRERHRTSGSDPMKTEANNWFEVEKLIMKPGVFEVHTDDDDKTLPVRAKFLPLAKKQRRLASLGSGISTGVYCPVCEEELKADTLHAEDEVRILLVGRAGSGKTVYITQLISEMLQGSGLQAIKIEGSNEKVDIHYNENRKRLMGGSDGFIRATGKSIQAPYVYLLKRGNQRVRLVLQDIAGEDCQDRLKYRHIVERADMVMFFIDPWHIPEMRMMHDKAHDSSCEVVSQQTMSGYDDLNGVFNQMLNGLDGNSKSSTLAAVMLVKGDYLIPPMLAQGDQPESVMMRSDVSFAKLDEMEFAIGMRSSFVRLWLNQYSSSRQLVHSIESKFRSRDIRFFVTTSLGQSTHMKQVENEMNASGGMPEDQFGSAEPQQTEKQYVQVLERSPQSEHILDAVIWCMRRNGINFWD